jgi:CspA family cold shock protein
MAVEAVVRLWHDDEGWGVLDSAATPGGCWAHFSALAIGNGYRSASAGDVVVLEFEDAGQDGYAYRAVRFWPAGADPVDRAPDPPGAAYRSTLTLSFDDDR